MPERRSSTWEAIRGSSDDDYQRTYLRSPRSPPHAYSRRDHRFDRETIQLDRARGRSAGRDGRYTPCLISETREISPPKPRSPPRRQASANFDSNPIDGSVMRDQAIRQASPANPASAMASPIISPSEQDISLNKQGEKATDPRRRSKPTPQRSATVPVNAMPPSDQPGPMTSLNNSEDVAMSDIDTTSTSQSRLANGLRKFGELSSLLGIHDHHVQSLRSSLDKSVENHHSTERNFNDHSSAVKLASAKEKAARRAYDNAVQERASLFARSGGINRCQDSKSDITKLQTQLDEHHLAVFARIGDGFTKHDQELDALRAQVQNQAATVQNRNHAADQTHKSLATQIEKAAQSTRNTIVKIDARLTEAEKMAHPFDTLRTELDQIKAENLALKTDNNILRDEVDAIKKESISRDEFEQFKRAIAGTSAHDQDLASISSVQHDIPVSSAIDKKLESYIAQYNQDSHVLHDRIKHIEDIAMKSQDRSFSTTEQRDKIIETVWQTKGAISSSESRIDNLIKQFGSFEDKHKTCHFANTPASAYASPPQAEPAQLPSQALLDVLPNVGNRMTVLESELTALGQAFRILNSRYNNLNTEALAQQIAGMVYPLPAQLQHDHGQIKEAMEVLKRTVHQHGNTLQHMRPFGDRITTLEQGNTEVVRKIAVLGELAVQLSQHDQRLGVLEKAPNSSASIEHNETFTAVARIAHKSNFRLDDLEKTSQQQQELFKSLQEHHTQHQDSLEKYDAAVEVLRKDVGFVSDRLEESEKSLQLLQAEHTAIRDEQDKLCGRQDSFTLQLDEVAHDRHTETQKLEKQSESHGVRLNGLDQLTKSLAEDVDRHARTVKEAQATQKDDVGAMEHRVKQLGSQHNSEAVAAISKLRTTLERVQREMQPVSNESDAISLRADIEELKQDVRKEKTSLHDRVDAVEKSVHNIQGSTPKFDNISNDSRLAAVEKETAELTKRVKTHDETLDGLSKDLLSGFQPRSKPTPSSSSAPSRNLTPTPSFTSAGSDLSTPTGPKAVDRIAKLQMSRSSSQASKIPDTKFFDTSSFLGAARPPKRKRTSSPHRSPEHIDLTSDDEGRTPVTMGGHAVTKAQRKY